MYSIYILFVEILKRKPAPVYLFFPERYKNENFTVRRTVLERCGARHGTYFFYLTRNMSRNRFELGTARVNVKNAKWSCPVRICLATVRWS